MVKSQKQGSCELFRLGQIIIQTLNDVSKAKHNFLQEYKNVVTNISSNIMETFYTK